MPVFVYSTEIPWKCNKNATLWGSYSEELTGTLISRYNQKNRKLVLLSNGVAYLIDLLNIN